MSTPENDQNALDAVRAADPAAGSAPDLARLHAALAESTGVQLGDDELAARRSRRTPRWIQVAAAVAGVALVGGGGYALGNQRDSASTVAGAPPISLSDSASRQAAGAQDAQSAQGEIAPQSNPFGVGAAASADSSKRVASSFFPAGYGLHTVFTARGLSTAGSSADSWAYDAASVYSAGTAARLAEALGVAGTPREDWGWTVGPNDGTGATVSLAPDGVASMSYYDPAKDPWACLDKSAPDSIETPAAGEVASDLGSAAIECDGDAAPRGAKAVAEAKDVLESLGVDTGALELESQGDGDDRMTTVIAYRVVDGQRTDNPWSVSLVADGVSSVNGPVAPLVGLGSYDVVSPAQAVERLGDPRFGASGGGPVPYAAREGVAASASASDDVAVAPTQEPKPTVPPTASAGDPLSWPVTEVTITKARLGLATQTAPDGSTTLVPSYELTGTDGSTWSVVAVVDQQLDFASR
ncbi:hypothetical protein [Cellulomonas edaphi]|uniref:Uncharacterized protein n=1 Tax=Cellulomonas edaphi TaxID=3053468 RepID=A0ABT7S455_9CELL|nr:hypothetical protein [Cellulomons edaphi]MDM7830403.1 hypothetical protein [Cellulomons edaphi]